MSGGGDRGRPGPGRPKGVPNKVTTALKEMILAALEGAGGQKYLQAQAKQNPVAFMSLLSRLLPYTLVGDKTSPIVMQIVNYKSADVPAIEPPAGRVIDA